MNKPIQTFADFALMMLAAQNELETLRANNIILESALVRCIVQTTGWNDTAKVRLEQVARIAKTALERVK